MKRTKLNIVLIITNIIFYLSLIFMIILDYLNYNNYLWGIATLVMVTSFLISVLPDLLINLGYSINEKYARNNILNKVLCLTLFLGFWSYLNDAYKYIALIVFGIIILYDLYLISKIHREVCEANIELRSIVTELKNINSEKQESIYNLLFKSTLGMMIYIGLPKEDMALGVIMSIAVIILEMCIIKDLKDEVKKNFPDKEIQFNKLLLVFGFNIIIIMVLCLSNIKIIFSCLIVGLNWSIVSDHIFNKKTSAKLWSKL